MQAWTSAKYHLPQHYYQGLLLVLQVRAWGQSCAACRAATGQAPRACVPATARRSTGPLAPQACPDVSSILALTSQLWQSGMLRMLCSAYTTTVQQQAASVFGTTNPQATTAAALSQLSGLLSGAGGAGDAALLAALLGGAAAAPQQSLLGGLDGPGAAAAQLMPLLMGAGGQQPQQLLSQLAAVALPPQAAPQQQPAAGRFARQGSGHLSKPQRASPPSHEPPAKRGRRPAAEALRGREMPTQLQQLLEIAHVENPSPREPPLAATAAVAAAPLVKAELEAAEQAAAAAVSPFLEAAQQAQAQQAQAQQGAAAQQAQAQAQQTQQAAQQAAAAMAVQRSLSLQRSLSASMPLPPNQHSVRIVTAPTSRQPSSELAPGSGGRGGGAAHRSGGRLADPVGSGGQAAGAAPRGATITTGAACPASGGAPPVTTGTPAGSGGSGSGGGVGMVSAFAAAAAAAPAPAAGRGRAGKAAPQRPTVLRVGSATITTGVDTAAAAVLGHQQVRVAWP